MGATSYEAFENFQKWKYTLMTTVLFLLIANPYTYTLVNKLFGKIIKIAGPTGCPTTGGLLVHTLVFTLLLRLLMELKV